MNKFGEELQEKIESGSLLNESDHDVKAFRKVFRALNASGDKAQLSADFADKIVARIIDRQKRQDARDHFWLGAGLFILAAAFIGTIFYTGYRADFGFLKDMSVYSGLFIFGFLFVLLLHWIDKRLVRKGDASV